MPAFTTHYLFGVRAYHHLKQGPLRFCISRYHGTYALGEQGPDPFFFNPLSYLRKEGNPADYMHEENMGALILVMAKQVAGLPEGPRKQCLLSYTAGFLGHYELDSAMHPYVYGRTDPTLNRLGQQYGVHFFLENDLDAAVLKHMKGMRLRDFEMHRVLVMGSKERKWIAHSLMDACGEIYPQMKPYYMLMRFAISMEWFFSILLQDRRQWKKKWVEKLENKIFGHPFYTGIIGSENRKKTLEDPFNFRHSVWRNPWEPEKERTESVRDLMGEAMTRYVRDLRALERYCCRERKEDDEKKEDYEVLKAAVGNRSLHSGFETKV